MGAVVSPYVFNGECNGYCTGTVRGLWETQSMHSKHEAVHTYEGMRYVYIYRFSGSKPENYRTAIYAGCYAGFGGSPYIISLLSRISLVLSVILDILLISR